MKYLLRKIHSLLPDKLFTLADFLYLHIKGNGNIYFPNIKIPKTFNEKMLFSKFNFKEFPIPNFADKILVREYVEKLIGIKYLVPVLGVYEDAKQIDFKELPSKFVMKTNHGSGWNIICMNKNQFNIDEAKNKLNYWLSLNYYNVGREWQYKFIKPKILVEDFLSNVDGSPITDYKLFCFDGKPQFIQVDLDRFTNHRRQFYDLNWNLQEFTTLFKRESIPLSKPNNLKEMIEIAKKLSVGFAFVRVDLYNDGERLFFGEFTLHHGGGCEPFIPAKFDRKLGELLKI